MSAKDRNALINKLFKVCKKHFREIKPPSGRSLLEHIVYACCLEDSSYEAADEAFARLQEGYFDWNEVRVTTSSELAEICKSLGNPNEAAVRIKKALHGVFENYYSFDIEGLKKENLGKAVSQFQKFRGVTPFVISYMAQNGLGGHSIPVDQAMLKLFLVLGAISESEVAKGKVPGLERAIPKSKGIEFASVVHQLAAAFFKAPFKKEVRDLILTIESSAKERFPKRERKAKKATPAKPKTQTATKAETKKAPAKKAATPKKPAKKSAVKKTPVKKATAKKTSAKKKKAAKTTKTTKKKSPTKRLAKKKPR